MRLLGLIRHCLTGESGMCLWSNAVLYVCFCFVFPELWHSHAHPFLILWSLAPRALWFSTYCTNQSLSVSLTPAPFSLPSGPGQSQHTPPLSDSSGLDPGFAARGCGWCPRKPAMLGKVCRGRVTLASYSGGTSVTFRNQVLSNIMNKGSMLCHLMSKYRNMK